MKQYLRKGYMAAIVALTYAVSSPGLLAQSSISLTYPKGGEQIGLGDTVHITWDIPASNIFHVVIYYSTDLGDTWDLACDHGGISDLSKFWLDFPYVFEQLSDSLILRIQDYDNPDDNVQSGLFSVVETVNTSRGLRNASYVCGPARFPEIASAGYIVQRLSLNGRLFKVAGGKNYNAADMPQLSSYSIMRITNDAGQKIVGKKVVIRKHHQ